MLGFQISSDKIPLIVMTVIIGNKYVRISLKYIVMYSTIYLGFEASKIKTKDR